MKILLHTGMPKTGTTALQTVLNHLRPALAKQGVLYPAAGFHMHTHYAMGMLANPLSMPPFMQRPYGSGVSEMRRVARQQLNLISRQVKQSKPRTMILSDETLFWRKTQENLIELKTWLDSFDCEIEVVAYLRQPSKFYLSNLQQLIRTSGTALPVEVTQIQSLVNACEAAIGKVSLYKFERGALIGNDISTDFFSRYLPDALPLLEGESLPEANTTISAESMQIMQLYHQVHYPEDDGKLHVDSGRLLQLLRRFEQKHNLAKRPVLKTEIANYLDQNNPDLPWLKGSYNIVFDGVDYDRLQLNQDNPFANYSRIDEICEVDSQVIERLQMLVMGELLPTDQQGNNQFWLRRVLRKVLAYPELEWLRNRLLRWRRRRS